MTTSLSPVETAENDNLINTRSITPGEYQIHIFIEGTKALIPPNADSNSITPVISVSAFNQDRLIKEKMVRSAEYTPWHEHLFFTKKIPNFLTFEKERFSFKVYDHRLLGKNAIIGQFDMNLTPIYFAENHTLLHQWVAINNRYKEKKADEIQGFIKFSANLLGPGDQAIKLEPELNEDQNKPVIFSPEIQTKCFQIKIQLMKGENLVQMDNLGGSIDCYLMFRFGGSQYKTDVIKNNVNPFWGTEILIPYSEPCVTEYLEIQIYDWDFPTKDEIVGSISFHKEAIKQKKLKNNFIWVNLYGSQLSPTSTENAQIMNANPSLATFWKGRLLLSFEISENPLPKLTTMTTPMKPELIQSYKKDAVLQWKLYIEIFYGLLFPNINNKNEGESYSIHIRWADQEINSEVKGPNQGVWEWNSRYNITCDFPYFNADELPDVFIYLCLGKKKLCYLRKPASLFLHQFNGVPSHYYLNPDKAIIPDLKDDEAGILKLRCVVAVAQAISDLSVGGWNVNLGKQIRKKIWLFGHIYQAQDLIPADADGNSDPFCTMNYYGIEDRTDTIQDTLNPIWYKTIKMEVPYFPLEETPPIVLKIFDEDKGDKKEFIGSAIINVAEGLNAGWIKLNELQVPIPVWTPLRYSKDSLCGKLLISFNFIEDSILKANTMKFKYDLMPDMEKYNVKIKVLGLRGLKSLGLIPVKRAFLKFDINSVRSPNERQALNEKKFVQTFPKEPGNNPNILTIIDFVVKLPKDYHLCPHLNCIVYDCVFKGLYQPSIGVFSINLANFVEKFDKNLLKKQRKLQKQQEIENQKKKHEFFEKIDKPEKNIENQVALNESFRRHSEEEKLIEKQADSVDMKAIEFKQDVESKKIQQYQKLPENSPSLPITIEMTTIKKAQTMPEALLPRTLEKVILDNNKINQSFIILLAHYQYDKIKKAPLEVNIPPADQYMPLGYDTKAARFAKTTKKHYRYYVSKPLEQTAFLPETPFDEFPILRGKRPPTSSLVSKDPDPSIREVGKFKGWVELSTMNNKDIIKIGNYDKEFMEKTHCFVRLYVINAESLAQLDTDSLSDPYLKVIIGNETQDNASEYQTDKTDCDFYKFFEFKVVFPGTSILKLQVWDKDLLTSDELIGETDIDLENRYFSKKWRKLTNVPIETRDLYHPLSSLCRGRIRVFLELIPFKSIVNPIWDVSPRPKSSFQIRVIIWDVEDVPNMDAEGCSDLYVTGDIKGVVCRTDTHNRAMNGKGSFNWRMLWDIDVSGDDESCYTAKFQVWDKDYLSKDDFIGECRIDIKDVIIEAIECENEVCLADKQTIEFKNMENSMGSLTYSFSIVPKSLAEISKVGKGREEPNHSPWLPPPIGRFEWTLNPLKLFNSFLGLKLRAKICAFCCMIFCVFIIIYQFPLIIGHLFVDAII